MPAATVVVAGLLGCGIEEPIGKPIGEPIWHTMDGSCDGDCPTLAVHGDDRRLEYRREGGGQVPEQGLGDMTDAGLGEYTEASAELGEVSQDSLPTCASVGGVDARVVLDDGETTFTLDYCITGPIGPPMERIDAFFDNVIRTLRDCEPSVWVEPDC
jgi:hypothetical protein